jgi:hypothetical protein
VAYVTSYGDGVTFNWLMSGSDHAFSTVQTIRSLNMLHTQTVLFQTLKGLLETLAAGRPFESERNE